MKNLVERALAIAFDSLGSSGHMIPFVLIAQKRGETECVNIVTDGSEKAAHTGRRLVREQSEATHEYAIATDACVSSPGQRIIAIIVEGGNRGENSAYVLAQPYDVTVDGARRLGQSLNLGSRPSELFVWDPLDWGAITPDNYIKEHKGALYSVNDNFESDENVDRTLRFLRARLRHHGPHLPQGSSYLVNYDDRGQSLTERTRSVLRGQLGHNVHARFMSERAS